MYNIAHIQSQNLHGRLSLNIYDEAFSLQNLLALAKTELDEASGEKAGSTYTHAEMLDFRYRFDKVNERLNHLNGRATELKRKQYNMIYTVGVAGHCCCDINTYI